MKIEMRSSSHPLAAELRQQDGGRFLRNRRRVAALSAVSATAMGIVALYQLGVLRRAPDLPVPGAASGRIIGSPQAYARLQVGDGFLGVLSYALTFALAGAGSTNRWRDAPSLPLAMAAKAALDASVAARLTWDEMTIYRGFCTPCVVAATATAAALPFTWPEARAAVRRYE